MDNNLQLLINTFERFNESLAILDNMNNALKNISETCQELSSKLEQINSVGFSDFISSAGDITTFTLGLIGLFNTLENIPIILNLVTSAGSAFVALLTSTAGPLLAVVGGIALLVGALNLFAGSQTVAEKEMAEFVETETKRREEIDKTTQSLKENAIATEKSVDAINADYSLTLSQVDQLVALSGTDGYAGNIEKAKYLVDEINKVLPNSVELTENGKVVWKDINGEIANNVDAIKLSIEALKQRAIVEEYQQKYLEAIKEESNITTERALAESRLAEATTRYQELQAKGTELTYTENQEKQQLAIQMDEYEKKIGSCNLQLAEIDDATNDYIASQQTLSGTTQDMANFLVESFVKLDESGKATWESLGTGIVTLDAQLKAHNDGTRVMTEQEVAASKLARESLINDMVAKAEQSGITYEAMLSELKVKNIAITEEEKKHLKMRFDLWSGNDKDLQKAQQMGLDTMKLSRMAGMSEMNDNDQTKLNEYVKKFAQSGNESGILLCQKLADSLESNGGQIDDKTQEIMNVIANIDNVDPTIIARLIGPSKSSVKDVKDTLGGIPDSKTVQYGVDTNVKGFTYFIRPNYRAMGGFPDTGELFVAREAGPELVGRINGKTAVANNDQIVSGISSGVYNAVRSAMSGNGGNGNMNIHATFVMDGEVVGKQVIKYHNGVVKRTGTTPLMI